MRRIRHDVERRRAMAGVVELPAENAPPGIAAPTADAAVSTASDLQLRRFEAIATPLELKDHYRVSEFLRYHDEEFLRNAYRGVLRREPDGAGLTSFLEPLRNDRLSKIEVLGRIR